MEISTGQTPLSRLADNNHQSYLCRCRYSRLHKHKMRTLAQQWNMVFIVIYCTIQFVLFYMYIARRLKVYYAPPLQCSHMCTHTKAYTHTYCSTHIPLQMVANSSELKSLVLVLLLLRALKKYVFPSTRSERRDGWCHTSSCLGVRRRDSDLFGQNSLNHKIKIF